MLIINLNNMHMKQTYKSPQVEVVHLTMGGAIMEFSTNLTSVAGSDMTGVTTLSSDDFDYIF